MNGTAPAAWQTGAALRPVGRCHASDVLLRIGAVFVVVALLLIGTCAGQAQAHGLHAGLTMQMPATWAESAASPDEGEAASPQKGCGVTCCAATGCAAAVMSGANPGIVFDAIDGRFALPGQTPPKPSPPGMLKRPPRA